MPRDGSVPWAHLDIAGVADTEKELPYYGKGATGWGVRTLVEWARADLETEQQWTAAAPSDYREEPNMHFLMPLILLVSSLTPARTWYPPSQPVNVSVNGGDGVQLLLMDFAGTKIDPVGSAEVVGEKTVDLKTLYPKIAAGGTYVLFTVPKGKSPADFEGTPLVIEARADNQLPPAGGPDVIKIEPLRYAVIQTPGGKMTAMFYYDVAPHTVDNFLTLASEGYYDQLIFHRIVPGFVLQGGDPKGDGSGGPGYEIPQEFNDRPHEEGVALNGPPHGSQQRRQPVLHLPGLRPDQASGSQLHRLRPRS